MSSSLHFRRSDERGIVIFMFRHRRGIFRRRRRSQLIDRLWKSRLQPSSVVESSSLLQDDVEDCDRRAKEQKPLPEVDLAAFPIAAGDVASRRSEPSGGLVVRRNRITEYGSGVRRCCSSIGVCWTSAAQLRRLGNDEEDEVDDEWIGARSGKEIRDRTLASSPARLASISCPGLQTRSSPCEVMRHDAETRLFDLLDVDQLETLVDIVCGGLADDDGEAGGCVPVLSRSPRVSADAADVAPHVVSCRLWRWPAIGSDDRGWQLKPMPCCVSSTRSNAGGCENDQDPVICCNPYHWSQLLEPHAMDSVHRGILHDDFASSYMVCWLLNTES